MLDLHVRAQQIVVVVVLVEQIHVLVLVQAHLQLLKAKNLARTSHQETTTIMHHLHRIIPHIQVLAATLVFGVKSWRRDSSSMIIF